jgi:hypothetical protein
MSSATTIFSRSSIKLIIKKKKKKKKKRQKEKRKEKGPNTFYLISVLNCLPI